MAYYNVIVTATVDAHAEISVEACCEDHAKAMVQDMISKEGINFGDVIDTEDHFKDGAVNYVESDT